MVSELWRLRFDNMALRLGADPARSPVFVISAQSVMLATNPLGRAELRGGGVTLGPDGRLCFRAADVQEGFAQAMQLDGARAPDVLLPSATQDIRLRLMPPDLRPLVQGGTGAHTVIILSPRTTAPASLRTALGLTAAEADIALSLARGMTPAEIATARGVSIHTVRNQAKSILSKTGSRRQSEVVAKVLRLQATGD